MSDQRRLVDEITRGLKLSSVAATKVSRNEAIVARGLSDIARALATVKRGVTAFASEEPDPKNARALNRAFQNFNRGVIKALDDFQRESAGAFQFW